MIASETAVRTLHFYINGKWENASGAAHPVTNPATGEVIASVPYATKTEVDSVVKLMEKGISTRRAI